MDLMPSAPGHHFHTGFPFGNSLVTFSVSILSADMWGPYQNSSSSRSLGNGHGEFSLASLGSPHLRGTP